MENTVNRIVEAFVNGESAENIVPAMTDWLVEVKDTVERLGRIQEVNNMLRYHREMALAAETTVIKNIHLDAVTTLEARLKRLNEGVNLPRSQS